MNIFWWAWNFSGTLTDGGNRDKSGQNIFFDFFVLTESSKLTALDLSLDKKPSNIAQVCHQIYLPVVTMIQLRSSSVSAARSASRMGI